MENSGKQFRLIYLIGIISTILVLCGIVTDMVIGSITGGDITSLPQTATERYNQLKDNWLLGLYNFDLLNVLNQLFLIPSIFAIYIAQKRTDDGYALLALIIFLIGTTIFVTNNSAFNMLELSNKYFSTNSEIQKNLLAAAGETMLAKGAHGSLSVFIGFALPTFANLMMSHSMIRTKIFTKATSYIGVVGNMLMLIYIILITFCSGIESVALMVAMPGGLLIMAWMIMYTVKLNKLRRIEKQRETLLP